MKFIFAVMIIVLSSASFAFANNQCVDELRIQNFHVNNPSELVLDAFHERYLLHVAYCPELPYAPRIAFQDFGRRVCAFDQLLVFDAFSSRIVDLCLILDVNRY